MSRRTMPFTICLAASLVACSSAHHERGEALPLNRVSFELAEDGGGQVRQSETIDVSPLSDGDVHYKLTLVTVDRSMPSNRDERVLKNYVADKAGHVVSFFEKGKKFNALGESQEKGRLIHVWMPTAARKDGGEIELEGFPEGLKVSGPVHWRKWSVWKAQYRDQQYLYDVNTGFLVGNIAGSETWMLDQSTVPGLVP